MRLALLAILTFCGDQWDDADAATGVQAGRGSAAIGLWKTIYKN